MQKISLFIRKITVAPVMALITLIVLRLFYPTIFASRFQFYSVIFFLTVVPLLAYPLQRFFPKYRDAGRDGQRRLAMLFVMIGYLLGCVFGIVFGFSRAVWIIYLEYLISGISVVIVNKVFHVKISGHACGIIGPVMLFLWFGAYVAAAVGILLSALVFASSLQTKRHTFKQLLGGAAVPIFAVALLGVLFGFK